MRKHRITDADMASLVSGHTLEGRPELDVLAQSLSEFRAASFETAPRPSAALAARLDVGKSSTVSETTGSAFDADMIETTLSPSRVNGSRGGLVRRMFTWIAGLGLGLKLALGATIAAAAVTGAGAAGVLPFGAQDTFDDVVSVVVTEESTDDGTEGDVVTDEEGDVTEGYDPEAGNFGSWVSEQAKNKPEGENFGKLVSGEAHNKPHGDSGDDDGEDAGDDEGDDSGDDDGDGDADDDDLEESVDGGAKKGHNN